MWLNDGRFLDNGGCGYVLKPKVLLEESGEWYPKLITVPLRENKVKILKITVLSARHLPKAGGIESTKGSIIDPYVELQLYGVDHEHQVQKTSVINDNGFNPTWNEVFKFSLIVSSLAILLIRVNNQNKFGHQRIAQYAGFFLNFLKNFITIKQCVVPVESIQPGYRIISLNDEHGNRIAMSNLFCKFEF